MNTFNLIKKEIIYGLLLIIVYVGTSVLVESITSFPFSVLSLFVGSQLGIGWMKINQYHNNIIDKVKS